jgi:hypothetical protein
MTLTSLPFRMTATISSSIKDPLSTSAHTMAFAKAKEMSTIDEVVISELLASGLDLSRIIEIFHDNVCEEDVITVARRLIVKETDENDDSKRSNYLCDLGTSIIHRSPSDVLVDSAFISHHIENLAQDAPQDFFDPIFSNLMNDPVVLSSGFIVDRSTAIEHGSGELKFQTCPWSRQPLSEKVYPLVSLKNQLQEFKLKRITAMMDTASNLLEIRNIPDFCRIFDLAQTFLYDIGERRYREKAKELTYLGLSTLNIKQNDTESYCILEPGLLATLVIRLYKMNEAKDNQEECIEKITKIQAIAREAIEASRFQEASDWITACESIQANCENLLVGDKEIPVARMYLELGHKRGGGDLTTLQRRVYRELLRTEDSALVSEFLQEEGIDAEDMTDLSPAYFRVSHLSSQIEDEEWHEAGRSSALEGEVSHIVVTSRDFRDQGWGNAKANLGLALYDSNGVFVARCNLYGTYRSVNYRYGEHAHRLLKKDEKVVSRTKPGYYYKLEYTVGAGGGHTLDVASWDCKMFHKKWFFSSPKNCYRMHDPEGDAGLYIGPVDNHGVADGRGRLEYDDGITFIGNFLNGLMEEGTNYLNGKAIHTMQGGRWTPGSDFASPEEGIVARYPLDAHDIAHTN